MSVLTTFHQATRGRICGLALTVATLFGACSAQSQTVYANFANRNGATKPVPAGLFGVGGTGSTVRNQAPVNLITTAGMNQTRFWISLAQVYATSTPNFSSIDSTMRIMQASGRLSTPRRGLWGPGLARLHPVRGSGGRWPPPSLPT
jgi:hypothetical protein